MRYTQFRIENYKGIEQLTLRLTGDVTTLIGLNESGKTTILEAIYCFSYGKEDLGAWVRKGQQADGGLGVPQRDGLGT